MLLRACAYEQGSLRGMRIHPSPFPLHPFLRRLSSAWAYARHELLYLSWTLMSVALLTPFSLSLMSWARYWPPGLVLLWLLLLMLVPFNLLRLMDALRVPVGRQQVVMLMGLLLTLLFASSTLLYYAQGVFIWQWAPLFLRNIAQKGNQLWLRDVMLFLLVTIVWMQGASLQQREFKVNGVGLFLRVGGLLAAPLIIWLSTRRLLWDAAPFMLLFFTAGLTAVALARAEEIEKRKTGFSASLTPRWLSLIFVGVLAVVMSGGLLASIISGQSIFYFVAWLTPFWTALFFGAMTVLATVAHLLLPALEIVLLASQRFAIWFVDTFRFGSSAGDMPYDETKILTAEDLSRLALNLDWSWKLAIFLLLLLVILLLTWTLNYIVRRVRIAQGGNELAGGQARAFSADASLGQRLKNRLSGLWHWRTAVSIRHIYQQMSQAAATSGYPRAVAETPYEYLKTLKRAWPANANDIQLITEAYVKIRYGEFPETEVELNQIWQAWYRLEKIQPMTVTPRPSGSLPTSPNLRKRIK